MIKLTEILEYDTSLPLEEQREEVQTFIREMMQEEAEEYFEPQIDGMPKIPRLKTKKWYNNDIDNFYYIEEYYTYSFPFNHAKSGICATSITIKKP